MKIRRKTEIRAALLGLALALAGPALADDRPTLAVIDFLSTNGPVDSALLGAADLLEAELSRYDMRVVSRRELNLLRGERGLARSGTVQIRDFQGGALPWADFLLRGEYRHGPGQSRVHFSLVDAATGTERGNWQLSGERPADLLKNLDPILPDIAKAVCGRRMAPPRPRNQPGFTAIPEAASTFYHGLDHLVAGRPEYAVQYFRLAAASDPGFSLAVLGQAKAYELLGFPRVGDALRATLPAERLPTAQAAVTGTVLTVRFVNRTAAFTPEQMQRIRSILQATHGYELFEPDWIPALTSETDLKLTGEFPLIHGLDHRLWLRADHLIVFSAEREGLRAILIDMVRGQMLGTATGGATDLDGLCTQAVAIIRQPLPAEPGKPVGPSGQTHGPAARLRFTCSVEEVAFALRRLADQPEDLARWAHLLCVMQPEQLPPGVLRALLDAHEAAIPPDAPDAAVWLASALWTRYYMDMQQAADLPDIEPAFAPLLQRYPDSLQAQVIRFHIARFLSARGETERSRKLAVEVAEKTAPLVLQLDGFIPLRGQYLDCIQQVDYSAFPGVIPPQGPRMSMLARDMFALAAYLSALAGDLTNARTYLAKAAPLERLTFYGPPRSHHFGGPVSIYPVNIGVWQTGHIGFDWKPPDPADEGRVQVGWTFLPYAMPGNKPALAAAPSTYTMFLETRNALGVAPATAGSPPPRWAPPSGIPEADNRSAAETWQRWLNTCTNSTLYAREGAFLSGLSLFSHACTRARAEPGVAIGDFAGGCLAEYRGSGPLLAKVYGEIRSGQLALRFYWLATHLSLEAGEPARAWTFAQQALAWRGRDDLKFSLRYQSALAAWKTGHDDTAALILRALAEDPRAKDLPLTLPYDTAPRRSLYLESVDLLEKVRSGPASDSHPAAIDLTPVKPYYLGGARRPGTKPRPKRGSVRREMTWEEIMAKWMESHEREGSGESLIAGEDVMPENYERWPEDDEHPASVPAPPRFGESYVYVFEDGVGMEFVWIDSMRIWAARYELTEADWDYVMTETELGGRLPKNIGYEEAVAFCAALTRRAGTGLPEGYGYRVPTVEEWERLARCGTDRAYPWGADMPPAFGNYCDQSYAAAVNARGGETVTYHLAGYRDGHEERAPVEESGRNEWGLYGMGGNLWDWATSPSGEPMTKGAAWMHSWKDLLRVDAGYKGGGPGGTTLRCILAPAAPKTSPALPSGNAIRLK